MKKQEVIIGSDSSDFGATLDSYFKKGYEVVPGTVAIAGKFPEFRYIAIVKESDHKIHQRKLKLIKQAVKNAAKSIEKSP